MKLYATITNEKGKKVSISSNERLDFSLFLGNKRVVEGDMIIKKGDLSLYFSTLTLEEDNQCIDTLVSQIKKDWSCFKCNLSGTKKEIEDHKCTDELCDDCGTQRKYKKGYGLYCPECWGDVTPPIENPFQVGDKVRYKDGDTREFIVYAVYGPTKVSLGLHDYPDVEQDIQVDISLIEKVKGNKQKGENPLREVFDKLSNRDKRRE